MMKAKHTLTLLLAVLLLLGIPASIPGQAIGEGTIDITYEKFLNGYNTFMQVWCRLSDTSFSARTGVLGEAASDGRVPFMISEPGCGSIEGFLLDGIIDSFTIYEVETSGSMNIASVAAIIPLDFGEKPNTISDDLFGSEYLMTAFNALPWMTGTVSMVNGYEISRIDAPPDGSSSNLNIWFFRRAGTDAAYDAGMLEDIQGSKELLLADIRDSILPFPQNNPLSEAELDYFTLNKESAISATDQFWESSELSILYFMENERPRIMIVYEDESGMLYDYFNGRAVFRIPDNIRMGRSEFFSGFTIQGPSETFKRGTRIQTPLHEPFDDVYVDWFFHLNPQFSAREYEGIREFYRFAIPEEHRFPRSQSISGDHPLSRIPRTRDNEAIENNDNIHFIGIRYRSEFDMDRGGTFFVYFLARKEELESGHVYVDVFTGEWLNTREWNEESPIERFNHDYLDSLRPGCTTRESKRDNFATYLSTGDYEGYDMYLKEAKTMGDLRRIYEMLPENAWYLLPSNVQVASPPAESLDKTIHPVYDELSLREAIDAAKKSDTILVLCDISIYSSLNIENKNLTLTGLDGQQPTIRYYADFLTAYHYYGDTLDFVLDVNDSTLHIRNLRFTSEFRCRGIFASDSKLVLGEGVVIEGTTGSALYLRETSAVLDGARIINNRGFGCVDSSSSSLHMKSGEIAHNQAFWHLIDIAGSKSTFLMEGGSIHHNVGQMGMIRLYGDAKMTMKGGEIRQNYGGDAGGVYCDFSGGTLVMEGGEIRENAGYRAGGVTVFKGKVLVKGGIIADNIILSPFGGHNVYIMTTDMTKASDKVTFELKGGTISGSAFTDDRDALPSVKIYGKYSSFVYSSGQMDVDNILVERDGKFSNKTKKK